MIAVADTSGLVALFNRSDPEHNAVSAAADACGLLVISPFALTEVHQIASIRADRRAADAIIAAIARLAESTRVVVVNPFADHLRRAVTVRRRYADLNLDLADAGAVVAAADYRTDAVLTLDRRDFRTLRPLTSHAAFRLLPDDAP